LAHTNRYVNREKAAPSSIRQEIKKETRDALIIAGAFEFGEKGIDAPNRRSPSANQGRGILA
jgi:hypothetical protein